MSCIKNQVRIIYSRLNLGRFVALGQFKGSFHAKPCVIILSVYPGLFFVYFVVLKQHFYRTNCVSLVFKLRSSDQKACVLATATALPKLLPNCIFEKSSLHVFPFQSCPNLIYAPITNGFVGRWAGTELKELKCMKQIMH